jgi:hypothetical protein
VVGGGVVSVYALHDGSHEGAPLAAARLGGATPATVSVINIACVKQRQMWRLGAKHGLPGGCCVGWGDRLSCGGGPGYCGRARDRWRAYERPGSICNFQRFILIQLVSIGTPTILFQELIELHV